jgi:hypothetical protein
LSSPSTLQGSEAFDAPILSADGSTVAFVSTQALAKGAESGVENVYAENVAPGAITLVSGGTGMDEYAYTKVLDPGSGKYVTDLTPAPDKAPGTGGDLNSDVTSVSGDGKLIAYESYATDLGGNPIQVIDEVVTPSRGYVYDATGVTTSLHGTSLADPSATIDTGAVNTVDPVLSGDGSRVFYAVRYVAGGQQLQNLYQYMLATGATTPVSVAGGARSLLGDDHFRAARRDHRPRERHRARPCKRRGLPDRRPRRRSRGRRAAGDHAHGHR